MDTIKTLKEYYLAYKSEGLAMRILIAIANYLNIGLDKITIYKREGDKIQYKVNFKYTLAIDESTGKPMCLFSPKKIQDFTIKHFNKSEGHIIIEI